MAADDWLQQFENLDRATDQLKGRIWKLSKLEGNEAVQELTAIRRKIAEGNTKLERLERSLDSSNRHLVESELLRRRNHVQDLRHKCSSLLKELSAAEAQRRAGERRPLGLGESSYGAIGDGGGDGGRVWGSAAEQYQNASVPDMLAAQSQIVEDQEQTLDLLSQSIKRQGEIALTISNELDEQSEVLDDLGVAMDRTDVTLKKTTEHVVTVTEKAQSTSMLCCMVLLIIGIAVVFSVK